MLKNRNKVKNILPEICFFLKKKRGTENYFFFRNEKKSWPEFFGATPETELELEPVLAETLQRFFGHSLSFTFYLTFSLALLFPGGVVEWLPDLSLIMKVLGSIPATTARHAGL